MGRLAGKVAIVTGAGAEGDSVGIGRAIATVLAGQDAQLCCVDLDLARAQRTVDHIIGAGGEAFAMCADVSQAADCDRTVAATLERFGRLSVLVNNVGLSRSMSLETWDEGLWSSLMDTNLKSVVLMSRAALAPMKAQRGGAIVNISSIAGLRAHGAIAYGPSKAAMAQLTREIAVAYGPHGIRANTVSPGHIMTAHVQYMISDAARERRRRVGPLRVEGDAWDIAAAACFLASDEARFITAVDLPVDGGVTATASLAAYELICSPDP
jgi:NAD(P)-dependent dehydrogenase (short-subunit alcohol dehydrogenase family)